MSMWYVHIHVGMTSLYNYIYIYLNIFDDILCMNIGSCIISYYSMSCISLQKVKHGYCNPPFYHCSILKCSQGVPEMLKL